MRIAFTGGGTGGHFYPLIAVAEEIRKDYSADVISFFYFGEDRYDAQALAENQMHFVKISAGKKRVYSSPLNFLDNFKIIYGIVQAIFKLSIVYPDVIFSKGGYVAFPVLFAARILRIPIVIHDSDTVPGRVSLYSAKFAKYVCVSWHEAGEYMVNKNKINANKIIYTGLPLRKEINPNEKIGVPSIAFANLSNRIPTILIIGGSQGSEVLNDAVLKSLGVLLRNVQIIHQTGINNFERVKKTSSELLKNFPEAQFYMPLPYIDQKDLRFLFSKILIVVSRGGSQMMEFFAWGIPSIVVPISVSAGDHQRQNAYAAMRLGASVVIEEKNLTPKILENEILRLVKDGEALSKMVINTKAAAKLDGSKIISELLIDIVASH